MKKHYFIFFISLLLITQPAEPKIFKKIKKLTTFVKGPGWTVAEKAQLAININKEINYWATASTKQEAAIHEAGHTLVAYKLGFTNLKVHIYPTTHSHKQRSPIYLGTTYSNHNYPLKNDVILNQICMTLAGGIATKILLNNNYGTGNDNYNSDKRIDNYLKQNGNDLQKTLYEIRSIKNQLIPTYYCCPTDKIIAEETTRVIRSILTMPLLDRYYKAQSQEIQQECYQKAKQIIEDNLPALHALAEALIQKAEGSPEQPRNESLFPIKGFDTLDDKHALCMDEITTIIENATTKS